MAKLRTYHAKRDFGKTAEPRGKAGRKKGFGYVIQKHDATRLHYDLRLELDGVMLSWAVTRGPSLVPGEKRLAIHVEDHPIEYNKFEGTIPKGQYGGGTVMVWDRGTWTPEHDPHKGMKKGHLDFELHGEKLQGPLASRAHAQAPGRTAGAVAADQGDRRIRPQEIRSGYSGGDAELRRDRPDHGRDRRRQEKSLAFQPKREGAVQGGQSRGRPRPQPTAAPKPRARTPRRKTAAKRSGKKAGKVAGAREARLPDFIAPCLATLSSTGAGHRRLGPRDQVRRLPHPGPDRRRQGHAEDAHRSRLDRANFRRSRAPARRLPTMTSSSTARSPRSMKTASPISPRLQDDLKNGRQDRMVYYVFDLLHLDGQDLTGRAADRAQARAGGAARRAAEERRHQAERALRGRRPDACSSTPATCTSKASCRSAPTRPIAPAAAATGSRSSAPATRNSSSSATSPPTSAAG